MSNNSKYPWEIPVPLSKRISRKLRKLARRNATFKVGENMMEVPEDIVWTFLAMAITIRFDEIEIANIIALPEGMKLS